MDEEGPKGKKFKGDDLTKKTRSSKACDQCRRTKCKCSPQTDSLGNITGPCQNCAATNQECTFNQNSKKRGPPKGYIDAVESRLHRMESLLGNLLINDDPRAQALLSELIGDEDTKELFAEDLKAAAQAGTDMKARRSWILASAQAAADRQQKREQDGIESPLDGVTDTVGKPRTNRKRKVPHDLLDATMSTAGRFPATPSDGTIAHTGAAGAFDPSCQLTELSDVVGQLSLDENSEIRYHGRSSGLYLISNSSRYQNFFWRFPKGGIWPTAVPEAFTEANAHRENQLIAEALAILPDAATQNQLLTYYWNFVHPHFPIIHRPWFQAHYASTNKANIKPLGTPAPLFLLLVMLGLSARYKEPTADYTDGTHWPVGDQFIYHARMLTSLEGFGGSHLSSCQGLLLMAYCQIGTGAMAVSWGYAGQAIRMAQDLGLFRDADRWYMPTMFKFSREEIQSRKRVWWGCFIIDKYCSSYIGRPMGIFERDWDTSFPSEDETDEMDQWHPLQRDGSPYTSIPDNAALHSISCFNRSAELSIHISRIISNIYAIRVRVLGQSSESLLAHLDQGLARFYLQLPPHLQYAPTSNEVPLPAILTLHCQFFTALILLHRPFIPLRSDPANTQATLPSHAIATTAANAIANIAQVYDQSYGLDQSTPFMIYYIFTAAIMHVTNARWPAEAEQARSGLMKCIKALESMRVMWGGAARQMELLYGLVDFSKPPAPSSGPGASMQLYNRPTPELSRPGPDSFEQMSQPFRTAQAQPSEAQQTAPHFPFANIPASLAAPKELDVMYDDWLSSFLRPSQASAAQQPVALPPMAAAVSYPLPSLGPSSFNALYMPSDEPSSGDRMDVLSRAAMLEEQSPAQQTQTSDFLPQFAP